MGSASRTILAIDPGTTCGWAIRHDANRWTCGTWNLANRAHEGGGMRFLRLRASLAEAIEAARPELVAYEQPVRFRSRQAGQLFGGFMAVIQEECERRKLPYIGITQAKVKKVATGKGNAGKPDVHAAAVARWAREFTEDEADAMWVAEAAWQEVGA